MFLGATAVILAQRRRIRDLKGRRPVSHLSVQIGEKLLTETNRRPTRIMLDH